MKSASATAGHKGKVAKISVLHAWESPVKRKSSQSSAFGILLKYLKLYCEHSTLAGYKYLAEPRRTWTERIMWTIAHATMFCILAYFVADAYLAFTHTPIVTTMESDNYPTNKISFPGVAICSINRISRESAQKMATEVANQTEFSFEEILEMIRHLGDLYESMHKFRISRHTEVDNLLRDFYGGEYDITEIMKRLTPECSAILLTCLFNGQKQNCSDIFSFEKTQDGFCCTFNYAPSSDQSEMEVVRVKDLGIQRGLTVVMEPLLNDYFYTILPFAGWKVTIFNPSDYPDNVSGGVTEVLVSPLTETYVKLEAVSFYSTDQTKQYSVKKRKCIFSSEMKTHYGLYSYSDCLVNCREEELWRLCKCIPFAYPTRADATHERRVCTTVDIPCLARHRTRWLSVYPHDEQELDVVNGSNTLHCHNCYPACNDVYYVVDSSIARMSRGLYRTNLLDNVEVVDQSIIHVFFSRYGIVRLKQDIAYTWYELLSDIGGICGVFIGFSIISVVELLYFALLLLRHLYRSCVRMNGEMEIEVPVEKKRTHMIYWDELAPRARTKKAFLKDRY